MKKFLLLSAALVIFPSFAFAAKYKVDPDHTKISFKIKHMTISSVPGNFKSFEGSFEFDPENIKAAKAEAKIDAKSIDTDNQKRDDHLRNEDFFNVAKNPTINFVSKEIKDVKGKEFTVLGDLTINGVTKPVELEAEFLGEVKDPWGNERAGFTAEGEINRKDFGLTWNKLLETGGLVVGEEVKIEIEVEGIKQK